MFHGHAWVIGLQGLAERLIDLVEQQGLKAGLDQAGTQAAAATTHLYKGGGHRLRLWRNRHSPSPLSTWMVGHLWGNRQFT